VSGVNLGDKYWRLLRSVLGITLFTALSGFVLEYFADYGFSFSLLTREQIIARAAGALGHGMQAGVFLGFPIWLAIEDFRKPKRPSRMAHR
jgi:hypothetical protein